MAEVFAYVLLLAACCLFVAAGRALYLPRAIVAILTPHELSFETRFWIVLVRACDRGLVLASSLHNAIEAARDRCLRRVIRAVR